MRVLVRIEMDGGSVGLTTPYLDLDCDDWKNYLRPLAELVAAAHPEATWTARPLVEGEDETEAVLQ